MFISLLLRLASNANFIFFLPAVQLFESQFASSEARYVYYHGDDNIIISLEKVGWSASLQPEYMN
jgi:hypothetical protein